MKKFKLQTSRIVKAVLIIVLVAFISSCESWIDPEINVDPTAPDDVPMSLLMPRNRFTSSRSSWINFSNSPTWWSVAPVVASFISNQVPLAALNSLP